MDDIRKVFTLQWVGPFDSFASLRKYLNNPNTCNAYLFSFYYCVGSKKGRGYAYSKQDYRYFGLHKADSPINMRVNVTHEKLSRFREPFSLWVGSFSNCEQQNPQNIEDVETLFISTYSNELTENVRKKSAMPRNSICIINLWYKPSEERWVNRKKEIGFFDDVLVYEKDINKFSKGSLAIVRS